MRSWPHFPNRNVFNDRRNSLYDKSASFRCDGRLFHRLEPAAKNALSPKVLNVHVTTHVQLDVVCSRRSRASEMWCNTWYVAQVTASMCGHPLWQNGGLAAKQNSRDPHALLQVAMMLLLRYGIDRTKTSGDQPLVNHLIIRSRILQWKWIEIITYWSQCRYLQNEMLRSLSQT